MKARLKRLFKGGLEVEVRGDKARFLDAALRHGLALTGIRSRDGVLLARLDWDDISLLRMAARESRCHIRFRRRIGWPFFLALLRRRPALPVMLSLGIALMLLLSTFIVEVRVESAEPLTDAERQLVYELAEQAGLKPGATRLKLDMEAAEQAILDGFPQLFYVEAHVRGQRVTLSVVRRSDIPPSQQLKPPGDIVAGADGVIIDVLVRRGMAAVVSGDPVQKGDILVYGWDGDEAVAADAIVTARVWAEGYGECPLTQMGTKRTGRVAIAAVELLNSDGQSFRFPERRSFPWQLRETETVRRPLLLWRNISLPVEVIISRVYELHPYELDYSAAQARALARGRAELNARSRLFARHDLALTHIVSTDIADILLEAELARAQAHIEARTEIGLFVAHEQGVYAPPLPEIPAEENE